MAASELRKWGYVLLSGCVFCAVSVLYAAVGSKVLPTFGIELLDWIKEDEYYCVLIPLTLPVTLFWVLVRWMCLELFRHN